MPSKLSATYRDDSKNGPFEHTLKTENLTQCLACAAVGKKKFSEKEPGEPVTFSH
jgi:hypothetical protein